MKPERVNPRDAVFVAVMRLRACVHAELRLEVWMWGFWGLVLFSVLTTDWIGSSVWAAPAAWAACVAVGQYALWLRTERARRAVAQACALLHRGDPEDRMVAEDAMAESRRILRMRSSS